MIDSLVPRSHCGNSSVSADKTHSTIENCDPNPSVAIMMKKKIAHNWGTGMRDRASG